MSRQSATPGAQDREPRRIGRTRMGAAWNASMRTNDVTVIIVGGGIGGLSLALALHEVGVECRVFEAAPDIKPLGVGLNLLPHATAELKKLGLLDEIVTRGVETRDVSLYTAHGQLVY